MKNKYIVDIARIVDITTEYKNVSYFPVLEKINALTKLPMTCDPM